MIFRQARLDGAMAGDPLDGVDAVKKETGGGRRPFAVEELRRVLAVADEEWRGMVLVGFYTGQRLGDIARLTRANLDLSGDRGAGLLMLTTSKTGRHQTIPLHPALRSYLAVLDLPKAMGSPLFPRAALSIATGGKSNALSSQFGDLLAPAGLRENRSHLANREGRDQALARVYGVDTKTLQRWKMAGAKRGEECPVEHPGRLLAWWSRRMKRPPVPGIQAAALAHPEGIPGLPEEVLRRGGAGASRASQSLSFHSLRHTATSHLKAAGVSASVVMDLIGHEDVAMSRLYTHTGDEERRKAVDSLPSL